jgi:hypothetical protein
MPSGSVGIIYKHHHEPARIEAEKLKGWFKQKGIKVFSEEMKTKGSLDGCCEESMVIPKTVDWGCTQGRAIRVSNSWSKFRGLGFSHGDSL